MSRVFILISIIIVQSQLSCGRYLQVENRKRLKDRDNVIKKGTWIKNNDVEKQAGGTFMFRGNLAEADNMDQGNHNPFDMNIMSSQSSFSTYVERNKRSSAATKARRHRRYSRNICDGKDCKENNNVNRVNDKSRSRSKIMNKVESNYPYQINFLLHNNKIMNEAKNDSVYAINYVNGNYDQNYSVIPLPRTENSLKFSFGTFLQQDKPSRKDNKASMSRESMNERDNNSRDVKLIGAVNKTESVYEDIMSNKVNRDVIDFDLKDSSWRSSSPIGTIPMIAKFKVKSKAQDEASVDEKKTVKTVSERGMIKILGVITKTFKKILRQHEDIKDIQKNLQGMSQDFLKNIEVMSQKLRSFDTKYQNIVALNDRSKLLEDRLKTKEQQFNKKEQELSQNLLEFESQQKKFLAQQRQFYNIQKLMLEQNERINKKQDTITKTQTEISYRQNNFARILKKVKQIYTDKDYSHSNGKAVTITLFDTSKNTTEMTKVTDEVLPSTTEITTTTESVKINLFSLQSVTPSKLVNQDDLLLKDKDYNSIDDLIYKYYFNNTFIDDLMKGLVSAFLSIDDTDERHNSKNKRQEAGPEPSLNPIETTILLPINKTEFVKNDEITGFESRQLNRKRRWIKNHVKRKSHRKNRSKLNTPSPSVDDAKTLNNRLYNFDDHNIIPNEDETLKSNTRSDDPFKIMATNFCNAIGQNSNDQVLSWCVEKSLRKLKNIAPVETTQELSTVKSIREFIPVFTKKMEAAIYSNPQNIETTAPATATPSSVSPAVSTSSVTVLPTNQVSIVPLSQTTKGDTGFFPDNEQLEFNLKEYDLKPDTEGNVYYDGSWHSSAVIKDSPDQFADPDELMFGLDSNSKIDDMDPANFDGAAMRRALVSRMKYEALVKKMNRLRI